MEPLTDGGEQEVKVRVEMDEDDGGCTAHWDRGSRRRRRWCGIILYLYTRENMLLLSQVGEDGPKGGAFDTDASVHANQGDERP